MSEWAEPSLATARYRFSAVRQGCVRDPQDGVDIRGGLKAPSYIDAALAIPSSLPTGFKALDH